MTYTKIHHFDVCCTHLRFRKDKTKSPSSVKYFRQKASAPNRGKLNMKRLTHLLNTNRKTKYNNLLRKKWPI